MRPSSVLRRTAAGAGALALSLSALAVIAPSAQAWNVQGSPIGNLDEVSVVPGGVVVRGWAWDPSTSSPVAVTIDSSSATSTTATANLSRPDVPRVFPDAGGNRGFEKVIDLPAGTHEVCATADDVAAGDDRRFPCLSVTVPGAGSSSDQDGAPVGNFERVVPVDGGVRVVGWVGDERVDDSLTVAVTAAGTTRTLTADERRPDVPREFPELGPERGFDETIRLPAGDQRVCVTALSAIGEDKSFGCKTVTVPGASQDDAPAAAAAPAPPSSVVTGPATEEALADLGWMGKEEARRGRVTTVTGSNVPGSGPNRPSEALKFELRAGEMTTTGSYVAPRTEVYGRQPAGKLRGTPYQAWPDPAGAERWYKIRMYVPTDFRTARDTEWLTVTQWKGLYGGSPPISIEFKRDGIRLGGARTQKGLIPNGGDLGPIAKGEWTELTVGMRLSNDRDKGWVEVYRDGKKVLPRTSVATMDTNKGKPDPVYLKQGIYRTKDWSVNHTLYFAPVTVSDRAF